MSLDDKVQRVIPVDARYERMNIAINYSVGVAELNRVCLNEHNPVHPTHRKQDGTTIFRPLKFRENIQARVEDYELHARDDPERQRLFNFWFDSCSAIVNQKGSTMLKLNTQCSELIEIDPNFIGPFLPIDYGSLSRNDGWIELDSSQRDFKERAWIVALDGDTHLYRAYQQIVLAEKPNASMDLCVIKNTEQDELRAIYVFNLRLGSNAYGNIALNEYRYFLRVVPPKLS